MEPKISEKAWNPELEKKILKQWEDDKIYEFVPQENNFTIVFYNVENLFDTINDPGKIDEQFLPDSNKEWNTGRYKKKINDLGKVISSININELPERSGAGTGALPGERLLFCQSGG